MSEDRLVSGLGNPLDQWAKPPPVAMSPDLQARPVAAPTPQAPGGSPDTVVAKPQGDPLDIVARKIQQGESGSDPDPAHLLHGPNHQHFGFPDWGGFPGPEGKSHAAGKYGYQPDTWTAQAQKWMAANPGQPAPDFKNAADQDKVFKFHASNLYKQKTGRDLATDAASGKVEYAALSSEWPWLHPNYALHKGWADEDRSRYQGQHADATGLLRDLMEQINKEPAGSQERRALLHQAQEASQRASDSFEQLRKTPPVYKPLDMMENFGSSATMIALLGGLFARRPLTASLFAGGQAMQAQQTQNWTQFKTASDQWYQQAQLGLEQSRMAHDQIREVMEDERLAENERHARLNELFSAWQMSQQFANADRGFQIQQMQAWDLHNERAAEAAKRQYEAWLEVQGNAAYKSGDPAQIKEFENKTHVHALATKGPSLAPSATDAQLRQDMFNQLQLARALPDDDPSKADQIKAAEQKIADFNKVSGKNVTPRNVPAMIMSKYIDEHPDAGSEELKEAAVDFARLRSLDVGFASGVIGRQVVSLNTVAGHILRVEEYWDALKNGNVPRMNAIANRIALEAGKPEVPQFEIGRDIMSDEIVRLLTSTGGTEHDRAGMQQRLNRDFSPAQIHAAIDTLKDFTGQRYDALKQQYAEGNKAREDNFTNKFLTDKARSVYRQQSPSGAGGGGGTSIPVPPAYKNDDDGTGYKRGNEVWVKHGSQLILTPGAQATQ